jgi:uroporphyrinogen decarboxylase
MPKGLDSGGMFDFFGMDHIDIWDRDCIVKGELDPIPLFETHLIEETDEYTVQRVENGDIVKVLKNVPPPAMPQFISYPVTDRESWAEFKRRLDPDSPGRLPDNLAEIGKSSQSRTTPLGAWLGGTYGYIRNWMGTENASYVFYDDLALVEEMVEHLTCFYQTLTKRIFEAGVELDWVMFWEDMAYNSGSLLSPEKYRKYCMPFYRTMIELLHKNGVRVLGMDSDGKIDELIPIWLEVGITVMHPMEVAAGMDVRETRRKYGNEVSFLGGIDKRALARGPEAIDAEVIPKMRELLDNGGGFVVECDHAVPPDVSFANYTYFRELVTKLSTSG